jgi:hypothetical protein
MTEGVWIGICDSLKLTVQSDTWAELMEDISSTLDAMMIDLLSNNEFDRFMIDHGWQPIGAIPVNHANLRFDLPFTPQMEEEAYGPSRLVHQ